MDFESYVDALRRTGVIPVIKLENEEDAVPLANALREGGIYAAEVTFRAAGAEKVIAAIEKLENEGRLGELRQELRETAEARRIYAEDTLQELSERLGITKSCLNHRLRKILEIEKRHV